MKPRCGISLEHNPQVGFSRQLGGGSLEENTNRNAYFRSVNSWSSRARALLSELLEPVCGMFCVTRHLPIDIILQSLSRSSLWAASCLWPVTPGKRTRGETPPFSTASAILTHTEGLPECQERVTMATNQPNTMDFRSTGETRSCSVFMFYWLKLYAKSQVAIQRCASSVLCRQPNTVTFKAFLTMIFTALFSRIKLDFWANGLLGMCLMIGCWLRSARK